MHASRIAKTMTFGLAAGVASAVYLWRRTRKREVSRLAEILGWRPGASVADVGAGSGSLTLAAARHVGPSGQVYATEIDSKKVRRIGKASARSGLGNVVVVQAEAENSGLPSGCCEAILLRVSYHHFTEPLAVAADLYQALRPGGRLAVVDFPPRRWLTLVAPVKDVPDNRGGHGIPMNVLIQEMTSAGFEVEQIIPRWFLHVYCVTFRKPACA